MNKKLTLILSIVAILVSSYAIYESNSKNLKVAYVDTAVLLNKYEGMQKVKETMEKRKIEWRANLDTLSSELDKERKKLMDDKEKISQRERQLTEELITRKITELQQYQQAINQKAQEEESKLNAEVSQKINKVITEFANDEGFDVILGATQVGNLAFAKEELDVTEDILKRLQQ